MEGRTLVALRYLERHPEEAAALLEARPPEEALGVLAICSSRVAAEVLRRALPGFALACLRRLPNEEAGAVLAELTPGEAARLLRRAEGDGDAWLQAMKKPVADAIRKLIRYPDGTAGALMDARVSALPRDLSVAEAVERLRREPEHSAYYLYVVDRDQKLAGVLNYRDVALANPEAELASVMRSGVATLSAELSGPELRAYEGWRRFLALPVVDADGRLLGALRHDTVVALDPPVRSRRGGGLWRRVLGIFRRSRAPAPEGAAAEGRTNVGS